MRKLQRLLMESEMWLENIAAITESAVHTTIYS
jgi:hypothetical protein